MSQCEENMPAGSNPKTVLQCGDREFRLGARTYIMGILNVTSDSFSDGGLYQLPALAIAHAEQMLADGADIIDIGGESTRPFAQPVSPQEELDRILPIVQELGRRGITNLSIDTRNASTARACLDAGASWINDVSALRHDDQMASVAKNAQCLVLMHAKRTPDVMQQGEIFYHDVVSEVADFLGQRVEYAIEKGVKAHHILVDPGIGFGKRLMHNLELIRNLDKLKTAGAGVLCGMSRKAFIGELTGIKEASKRDSATIGALTWSVASGADIVRVHNVKAMFEALKVVDALRYGGRQI